jgi:hypothetical protein
VEVAINQKMVFNFFRIFNFNVNWKLTLVLIFKFKVEEFLEHIQSTGAYNYGEMFNPGKFRFRKSTHSTSHNIFSK